MTSHSFKHLVRIKVHVLLLFLSDIRHTIIGKQGSARRRVATYRISLCMGHNTNEEFHFKGRSYVYEESIERHNNRK